MACQDEHFDVVKLMVTTNSMWTDSFWFGLFKIMYGY